MWLRYQYKFLDRYLKIFWVILILLFLTIWLVLEDASGVDVIYKLGLAITTIGSGDITPETISGKLSVVSVGILALLTLGRILTRKRKMRNTIHQDADIIIYVNSDSRIGTIKNIINSFNNKVFNVVFDETSPFNHHNIFELENNLMINNNVVMCVSVKDILDSVPKNRIDLNNIDVKVITLCDEKNPQENLFRNLAICSMYEILDSNIFTGVEVMEHRSYFEELKHIDKFISWNQGKITSLVLHGKYVEPDYKLLYSNLVADNKVSDN